MRSDIGPYRIEERLGRGGMGEVYAAYDRRLDRRVALKRLLTEPASLRARARLRHEARAAAALSHPCIVPIFDILSVDEHECIVMELIDGPTVALMRAGGPLPVDVAIGLGLDVASGLAAAHARGILHRDLKAENVIVGPDGRGRILDFGLATRLGDPSSRSISRDERRGDSSEGGPAWSAERAALSGTYRTMSPEQARGAAIDERSDLFSLGILLYEMVIGTSPFLGATDAETLQRICTAQPRPLGERRSEVPNLLVDLIDALLSKEPAGRPSATSAAECLRGLQARIGPDADLRATDGLSAPATPRWIDETTRRSEATNATGDRRSILRRRPARAFSLLALLLAAAATAALLRGPRQDQTMTRRGGTDDQQSRATAAAEPSVLELRALDYLERFDRPESLDRAIELLRRATTHDPDDASAYALLARAYWRKYVSESKDPSWLDLARGHAERAAFLEPELVSALSVLGLVYVESGEHERARGVLGRARKLSPASSEVHRAFAELHLARGELDAAEDAYRRAVAAAPERHQLHDALGALLYRVGRYAEAEEIFQRSVELAPESVFGHRNLSAAYYMQGRRSEAASALERALAIEPRPSLYANLGTIYFSQGLYGQAVAAFEQAIESGGAHGAVYWAGLADSLRFAAGRDDEARDAYLRAVQLVRDALEPRPNDSELLSRLALYLAKRGDRRDALAALTRLESLDDLEATALFRIAVAHEVLGDRISALEALRDALAEGFSLAEVRTDPELLRLRSDPGFHRILIDLDRHVE
ncbi:MAG: tetratricopeptide repeat protein [Acidobacteriota bacterium]